MSEALGVTVDRGLCQNHGQCVYAAPQVFAFDDDEELTFDPAPDAEHQASVQQAVLACPVRAIALDSPGTP